MKKLKPALNTDSFSLYDFGALVMFCFGIRAPCIVYLRYFYKDEHLLKRRVLDTL